MTPGSEQFEMIRKRKFPVVGDGGGVWGLVGASPTPPRRRSQPWRTEGAVSTTSSMTTPPRVAEWLPELASMLGAKKPMRVPRFVGRLAAGHAGVVLMTELRGASNAKAKRELGWQPAHST